MKKISYSRVTLYKTCSKKFYYKYVKNIKDPINHSALFFGSALDATTNGMLMDLKNGNLKQLAHYQEAFYKNWLFGRVEDKMVSLPRNVTMAYAESDMDYELIPNIDRADIIKHKNLVDLKKQVGQLNMSRAEVEDLNALYWECLKNKGRTMVETLYYNFLPQIKEVIAVQKKVSLVNDTGEEVEGYLDFVLDFGDGPVICDLKTSTIKYDPRSASRSPQLATYAFATRQEYNTHRTAYVVVYKQILKNKIKICTTCLVDGSDSRAKTCDSIIDGKRCKGEWTIDIKPQARLEIIHGTIDPAFEEKVVEDYATMLQAVDAGIYMRNWDACMAYNKPCTYYEYCHKNKKEE